MKPGWIRKTLIGLLFVGICPAQLHAEWFFLQWMEKPASNGASISAKAEERTEFLKVFAYDKREHDDTSWPAVRQRLKEGDLIAYHEPAWESLLEILLLGQINKIGYQLFKYGHLAIVVRSADDEMSLRLLSSWSFKGPNIAEDLDALKHHSWDVYRLNQWERVDKRRFYEFSSVVRQKAENWYGYDFLGMFGLWNSNLQPATPEDIGHSYICSTVIVAALNYAGVKLDVSGRRGIADIVTPLQLVMSGGRIVSPTAPAEGPSSDQSDGWPILQMANSGDPLDAGHSD